MMSSYVVWRGQLPLVKDGAGCRNHHTQALLNQSTGATDLLTNTPQIDKRDEKMNQVYFLQEFLKITKIKMLNYSIYLFNI